MADESTSAGGPVDDFDVPAPSSDGGSSTPSTPPAPTTTPAAFSGGEPATPTPEQPAAPSTPATPLTEFLRAERLPEIPGETPEQTQLRLNAHWQGKSARFYREMQENQRRIDTLAAQHAEELRMIREAITPMAKEFYNRARAAETAAAAAEVPDRDSPEYLVWLNEQILLRDEQRREDEIASAERAREEAEQREVQQYYERIEGAGYDALAAGIQDPAFAADYQTLTRLAYQDVVDRWPNADPEDHLTFLEIAQRLDIRDWVERGIDPREGIRARVQRLRASFAAAAPAPTPAPAAAQPAQPPAAPQPSPTATRIAQEAQDAARRAPVTAAMPSRPAPHMGSLPDPSNYESDDDYVEAVLAGVLPPEEQRVAAHRKER